MPPNVSYAKAAASVDGYTTAWYFLRKLAPVRHGQRVLVIGGSGSVGSYAVQVAKRAGAVVHAVCSGRNVAARESLGADRVFDYTVEDFAASGQRYDVVFDTVAAAVRPVPTGAGPARLLPADDRPSEQRPRAAHRGHRRPAGPHRDVGAQARRPAELHDLLARDEVRVVIDRSVPLAEIAAAHRHVDSGRKVGNVVITVVDD